MGSMPNDLGKSMERRRMNSQVPLTPWWSAQEASMVVVIWVASSLQWALHLNGMCRGSYVFHLCVLVAVGGGSVGGVNGQYT